MIKGVSQLHTKERPQTRGPSPEALVEGPILFTGRMCVVLAPLVGLDCIPSLDGTRLLLDLVPRGQIAPVRARLTVHHRWTLSRAGWIIATSETAAEGFRSGWNDQDWERWCATISIPFLARVTAVLFAPDTNALNIHLAGDLSLVSHPDLSGNPGFGVEHPG